MQQEVRKVDLPIISQKETGKYLSGINAWSLFMLFVKLGINGNIGANEWTMVEMHVNCKDLIDLYVLEANKFDF